MKLGALVVLGTTIASVSFVACGNSGGGAAVDPVGSGSATKKGSAGGFSASLSAELKDGSGSGDTGSGTTGSGTTGSGTTGSGTSGSGTSGSGTAGTTMSGSGASGTTGSGMSGSGMSGTGAGTKTATGSASGTGTAAMTGSAGKGSGAMATTGSGAGSGKGAGAGSGKGSAVAMAPTASNNGGNPIQPAQGSATLVAPTRPADNRHHVNPPADLAAIKIDLEPNWDRDFDEAGTVSFVLKVPTTNDTRLFSFKYGYDLPNAPSDRDAYKKFLSDQKVLTVTLDRQRGAAWYLEGVDGAGAPAFRYLVVFGGKRLVCGGVLYKDKESTSLGPDLRDKVVAAAKKICETLQL